MQVHVGRTRAGPAGMARCVIDQAYGCAGAPPALALSAVWDDEPHPLIVVHY